MNPYAYMSADEAYERDEEERMQQDIDRIDELRSR